MQPLLIVPYKQAKSSLCCARRGAQAVQIMKSKKVQQRATNTQTQHQWRNNSRGPPCAAKAPWYGRIYRCTWERRKQWDKFNQSSDSSLILFFCSVSCNSERLSCEPGRFGFNDTNAIMRLKKNYLPMFLLQESVSLTWQWTNTPGIRKVQKVKDFAENPLGIFWKLNLRAAVFPSFCSPDDVSPGEQSMMM